MTSRTCTVPSGHSPTDASPWRRAARSVFDADRRHGPAFNLFLRALGLVYAAAFASLAVQVVGLYGERGILSSAAYLERAHAVLGAEAYPQMPTVLWWGCSDAALQALCWSGLALGLLVAAGFAPGPLLLALWALYLSMVSAGPVFLNYQWDMLLLEAGFLAPWLAPWQGRLRIRSPVEPPLLGVWLYRWLLFRLMFSSGWVKLRSDDAWSWSQLTALDFHFWTQPLPTWTAWWVHHAPSIVHRGATAATLVVELFVPWLIFLGWRGRITAFVVFSGFQAALMATGNFGFFNFLSLALGLPLLSLARREATESKADVTETDAEAEGAAHGLWRVRAREGLTLGLTALVLVLSAPPLFRLVERSDALPSPIAALERRLAPFRLVNGYGLFAVMTRKRPELVVESSTDGTT